MRGRRNGRGSARDRIIVSISLTLIVAMGLLVCSRASASDFDSDSNEFNSAQTVGPPTGPDNVGPKEPITAYNGSYTYSIPIEVPAFRGIEPKLKLSYDSARGIRGTAAVGSWLGVGWKLDGLSVIESVSGSWKPPADFKVQKQTGGRGSPANLENEGAQPADSFMLDGDELIACGELGTSTGPTTSPSCTVPFGGLAAYAGRIEN